MEYKLNGKTYTTKEVDFLELTKMAKCGLTIAALENMQEDPFTPILACVSYITGLDKEKANAEIMAHLKNGGTFEEVASCVNVLTECDFFKKAVMKQ